ncbi:MAG: molybdenum cofactor cytidylyltransferase [Myxococcota bacterium]|jgi:molybdenum cofactor cytidylyltransferase
MGKRSNPKMGKRPNPLKSKSAAVILAAGASTRMGRPKALLMWRGGSLLSFLSDCYRSAGCGWLVVVTAEPHYDLVEAEAGSIPSTLVVRNSDPSRGMLSSLQLGIRTALEAGAERVAFGPVDLPLSGPESVRAVLREPGDWVVPVSGGRSGHPAVLSLAACVALVDATPLQSPRDVLAPFRQVEVPVLDPGVVGNLNTPADLERWRQRSGEQDSI